MYEITNKEKRPCGKRCVQYLQIYCTQHHERFWIKQSHFRSGSISCKGCRKLSMLGKADNIRHIEELKEVNDKYIFCPNEGKWDYRCTICDYEGSSYLDKLKMGKVGCRCSKTFRHTKEDREKQIQSLIDLEDNILSFSLNKYKTTIDSQLIVECKEHGDYSCTVNNFVNHHSRCPECAKSVSTFGYYPAKKNIKDYLYLLKLTLGSEKFIKVGRSFNPEDRAKKISSSTGYTVTVEHTINSNHEQVVKCENEVLKYFEAYSYNPEKYFKGFSECLSLDILEDVKKYMNKISN